MSSKPKTKRKRKVITIQQKQEIISKFEQGFKRSVLCTEYRLPPSTVSTICAQKERLKSVKVIDKSTRVFKNRSLIVEVEKRLLMWIKEKQKTGDQIIIEVIREKALEIYEHVKKSFPRSSDYEIRPFKASQGWFHKFKKRADIANLAGSSNKNLYLHKKKQPPSSPTTVLIPDSTHPASPPTKIPKKQTKEFQEENLKLKKNCQENDFTDRQSIAHVSKMAENSQEISIKNPICVIEKSENVPDSIQFPHLPVPIPTAQPKSIAIPQPEGKKIFILADHQKNVMSSLALLWKSGKLCDAGIGNGLSTVMVHKLVLSAVCPKLLSVFGTDMLSQKFLQINLPQEVSTEALDAFADYMYNGILDLDPNILHQLKIIAKQLDMKDFEQLCDSQLPNTTHQQPTPAANSFVASNPMTGNVSMSQNVTTPVQPSPRFSSISSNSFSTNTIRSSDINDKISRVELLPKENRVTLFGHESEVALLDNNMDINSSGSFAMARRVKNEPVEPEERYEQSKFYSSIPVSNSSQTQSTNFEDASTSEFVLPFLDTTHSKATTNGTPGTSSKLKSNAFESSLLSNFVLHTEEKMYSQSNPLRENPSKPQNRTITQSVDKMVTSGSNKRVYSVGPFTAGRNRKQLSSVQLPV